MEIRGRHDIFRAAGLLLSVHRIFFFSFRPQLSFYAGLALIRLLVSCWCFYICKLLSWCPACLLCCPRVPFLHVVITSLCSRRLLGDALLTPTLAAKKKKKKSCCFAVTFLLSNNTSLPLFGCFNLVINHVKIRLVPQAVSWSVWSARDCWITKISNLKCLSSISPTSNTNQLATRL